MVVINRYPDPNRCKRIASREDDLQRLISFATSSSPQEPEPTREFPFYESIAALLEEKFPAITFLPHRDISEDTLAHGISALVFGNFISSDFIIADIGTPSSQAAELIREAYEVDLPILSFYRVNRQLTPDILAIGAAKHPSIQVYNDVQGLRDIVEAVGTIYQR